MNERSQRPLVVILSLICLLILVWFIGIFISNHNRPSYTHSLPLVNVSIVSGFNVIDLDKYIPSYYKYVVGVKPREVVYAGNKLVVWTNQSLMIEAILHDSANNAFYWLPLYAYIK